MRGIRLAEPAVEEGLEDMDCRLQMVVVEGD